MSSGGLVKYMLTWFELSSKRQVIMRIKSLTALLTIFQLVGCAAIGPGNVQRDRFDYNTAVSDSWKEQTLLNIVRLRYAEMPLFLEVASIVSGYSLESSVNLGGTAFEGITSPNSLTLGTAGKYTDRPTITYAPITGSQFNKNFMTPLPPSSVLFLIQAGWPADIVLPITLEAINGLRAQKSAGMGQRSGQDAYYRVIQLFKEVQRSGALGMRVIGGGEEEAVVMVIRRSDATPEVIAARDELANLLGMRHDKDEYSVVYAEIAKNDTEIAMLTRSILSIMVELAGQVTVPEQHVKEGRTVPSLMTGSSTIESNKNRLINIKFSTDKPDYAFVAVRYQDHWFWIDDRDFKSKRTFAYLMLMFSLTESGGKEGLPLVTIPAG